MTSLSELLARIDELDDEETIYAAEPWNSQSRAISALEDSPEARAAIERGLVYFLEVDLAREAVTVWSEWRDGRTPDHADVEAAVLFYARRDAFLPVAEFE